MLLLAALFIGGGTYALTGNKNLSISAGVVALIAFLVLYEQGKTEQEQLELALNHLNEEEQAYWRPVIEDPSLWQERAKELFDAA